MTTQLDAASNHMGGKGTTEGRTALYKIDNEQPGSCMGDTIEAVATSSEWKNTKSPSSGRGGGRRW